ncbi:MFS transporter [Streptomyces sp. NPDC058646]|uniref:MFS transporter n=1 Tax=Streptomyces sp. NPDC058646 TaxID=3346574 RepID=UPI0036573076
MQGFGPPAFPPPFPASFQDRAAPRPRRWWGLLVIALTQLLVLPEASAFDRALPTLQADLGLHAAALNPVTSTYVLAFGALLLPGGHLADLAGARKILLLGLAGFAAASALGGSAGDPTLLIAARALQGACAALLTPAALSLVLTGFTDPKARRRAFGIYAAIAAGGGAFGLFTGGWLLEALNWRASQYAAVPLALIAVIGVRALLPGLPGRTGARFDGPGVLLGSAGLLALTYGLGDAESAGWATPVTLLPVVGGALLLGAFLLRPATAPGPLLAPSVLRDRSGLGAVLTLVVPGFAVLALLPATGSFVQQVLGHAPFEAGLAHLPLAAAAVIASTQVSARLLGRVAPRVLIVAGLAVTALGLALLTGMTTGDSYTADGLPGMLLAGFGLGLALMPLLATATAGVAAPHAGGASRAVATAQHVGQAIRGAVLGTVVIGRLRDVPHLPEGLAGQLMDAYTTMLWIAVGVLLLAALGAGLLVTRRASGAEAPAVPAHRW